MYQFEIFNKFLKTKHDIGLGDLNNCIKLKQDLITEGLKQTYRHIQLFIHIPYCVEKCTFCVYFYNKLENSAQLKILLELLEIESIELSKCLANYPIEAIYIGGGTVSLLSTDQIQKLLQIISQNFNLSLNKNNEFTVELYPLNTNNKKLEALYKNGVNRLSFGIQSFDEKILKLNSRKNPSYSSFVNLISNAKKIGFNHINIDLLIGIEGCTFETLINDFELLANLEIATITIYINMNIFRSEEFSTQKDEYINWILQIQSKYLNNYLLNNGLGPNEFNVFKNRKFNNILSKRYEDTSNNDVICIGIGKYSDSSYGNIIFKYL